MQQITGIARYNKNRSHIRGEGSTVEMRTNAARTGNDGFLVWTCRRLGSIPLLSQTSKLAGHGCGYQVPIICCMKFEKNRMISNAVRVVAGLAVVTKAARIIEYSDHFIEHGLPKVSIRFQLCITT